MSDNPDILSLFDKLLSLQQTLREKCPWDKEQTHESLKKYLIEEAYEVIEAIEQGHDKELSEELGDLLYQILFHAGIAQEQGRFSLREILSGLLEKMTRRHPHVFGKTQVNTADEVRSQWNHIKSQEKPHKEYLGSGCPKQLPALLRAQRITADASELGFDWEEIGPVLAKTEEEKQEFLEAMASKDLTHMEKELGDLFFAWVNVGRFLSIDCEGALRGSIERFLARFHWIQHELKEQGRDIMTVSFEELDDLWNEAKRDPSPRLRGGQDDGKE